METITDRIYRLERIGDGGYSQSSNFSLNRYGYLNATVKSHERAIESAVRLLSRYFENPEGLGPFEQYLLGELCPPLRNSAVALVGARGCGKTATSRFLHEFVRGNAKNRKPLYRPIALHIDCNDIIQSDYANFSEVSQEIFEGLADELIHQLVTEYWEEAKNLVSFVKDPKYRDPDASFTLFSLALRNKIRSGAAFTRDSFSETVAAARERMKPIKELRFAVALAAQVATLQRNNYFYFCVDNIDPYDPYIQHRLLDTIVSTVNRYKLPVLVPVRLITSWSGDIRARIFRRIPHSGISPLKEVKKRSELLTAMPKARSRMLSYYYSAPPRERAQILLRAAEINQQFKTNLSYKQLFQSVCGHSVERGMSFVAREFTESGKISGFGGLTEVEALEVVEVAESALDFESKMNRIAFLGRKVRANSRIASPRPYQFVHNAMHGCLLQTEDYKSILENLFEDPISSKFSTIKYRILGWVFKKKKQRNAPLTLASVVDRCVQFGFEEEVVCQAIDSLHDPERRLVWCTGLNQFERFEILQRHLDQKIGITPCGVYYYRYLAPNLDYMAFMLARTEYDRSALIEQSLTRRMTYAIRMILGILIEESEFYRRAKEGREVIDPSTLRKRSETYIMASLASSCVNQALEILRGHRKNLQGAEGEGALVDLDSEVAKAFDIFLGYSRRFELVGLKPPSRIRQLDWSGLGLDLSK